MTDSVWAFDHAAERSGLVTEDLNTLRCFVICPTEPRDLYDHIFGLLTKACTHIGGAYGIKIETARAIDIASSGLVHPEIWKLIRLADFIVADVTGVNGNVMLELGVASAWHPKERVILIRQRDPTQRQLFDLQPVRHIEYSCTPIGFEKLFTDLASTIQEVIASSPFAEMENIGVSLPLSLRFDSGHDSPQLWTPAVGHRRIFPGKYLEFGSLHSFRHGWLTVGDCRLQNVRVQAEMDFTAVSKDPKQRAWMGIAVRSHGYFANLQHLVYLRVDGTVCVTIQQPGGEDRELGRVEGFDWKSGRSVAFDVTFNDDGWLISVGSVNAHIALAEMQSVFSRGRILVQGWGCWIGLRSLAVQEA